MDDRASNDPNGDDEKSKADRDDDEEKSAGKEARESSRTESAREKRRRQLKRQPDDDEINDAEPLFGPALDVDVPPEALQDQSDSDVEARLEMAPDEEATPLSNVEVETIDQSLNANVSTVEQFVETVHYRYQGSATEFAPAAQQAALSLAAQNGWSYKGRHEKPPLPTCQKGLCKGSFQGRFERTVVR